MLGLSLLCCGSSNYLNDISNEMNCLPTSVSCAETGHGCSDPEGMLLPFTQKVPREAAVEGKQQQWSLSVSRFLPFSPISRHGKQQFSCLQPLS